MMMMMMARIIFLMMIIIVMTNGQSSIDRRLINQQNLDQQIIKSIPKLNLASFGIDTKKGDSDHDDHVDDRKIKNSDRNRYDIHKESLENERNRLYSERMENFRNALREMEWEYFDRRQSSTRRPSTSRTTTTTTTSTTTTPRSYHYRPTEEEINHRSYRPIPQPTRSPNEYPLRDCQQECVPKHYLQHYYGHKKCFFCIRYHQ